MVASFYVEVFVTTSFFFRKPEGGGVFFASVVSAAKFIVLIIEIQAMRRHVLVRDFQVKQAQRQRVLVKQQRISLLTQRANRCHLVPHQMRQTPFRGQYPGPLL